MNKVLLKDIWRDMFRRSTLVAIPDLKEILRLNDNFTPEEIFFGIVRDALQEYEKYIPLFMKSKIYINGDDNLSYEFIDNFEAYLKGILPEDSIELIPTAVIGLALNQWTSASQLFRSFRYDPPKIYEFWYGYKVYWVHYLANRPLIEDYDEKTKDFTDKCAIYFMTKDNSSNYKVFKDQVYLEFCRYILNMKKNMGIQNLPIEVFQGLEDDFNRVDNQLSDFYRNSLPAGQFLM